MMMAVMSSWPDHTRPSGGSVREEGRAFPPAALLARCSDVFILNFQKSRESSGSEVHRSRRVHSLPLVAAGPGCHVCLSGRSGAAVRGVGGVSRPQKLAGAGGCSGEDPQRQMHVQVPDSAHDSAHRCLQTPPGTNLNNSCVKRDLKMTHSKIIMYLFLAKRKFGVMRPVLQNVQM